MSCGHHTDQTDKWY